MMSADLETTAKLMGVTTIVAGAITWIVTRLSGKQYCPSHTETCRRQEEMATNINAIYKILNGDDGKNGMANRLARMEEFMDSLRRLLEKGGAVL